MADLDGDGIKDLYTGCYEGGLYWMRGEKDHTFHAPAAILDSSGAVLRAGMFWDNEQKKWANMNTPLGIAAAAVDWDDDGDLDLILGSQDGGMYLRRNEGTAKAMKFASLTILDQLFASANEELQAGDQPLRVEGGHAMPVACDWDGDGRFDLLSGSGEGGAWWFRNIGEPGKPRFAAGERLVPKASGVWAEPGERTQVHVADFDGDGKLDLLLGDYHGKQVSEGKYEWHGWVWVFRRKA